MKKVTNVQSTGGGRKVAENQSDVEVCISYESNAETIRVSISEGHHKSIEVVVSSLEFEPVAATSIGNAERTLLMRYELWRNERIQHNHNRLLT